VAYGEQRPERSAERVRELRRELGQDMTHRPGLLSTRFGRYVDSVLAHSGYHSELTRFELTAGIERLAEPLLANGSLDPKSFNELCAAAEQSSERSRSVTELVAIYRSLVFEIEAAASRPTAARQERGTRRALSFMREHLAEPLTLPQVARVAGMAPDYFSRLFRKAEGVGFAHCLQELRIESAKRTLSTTSLAIEQVQSLCGFRTRTHFHRVFKESVGLTPIEYRNRRAAAPERRAGAASGSRSRARQRASRR
jgi:two-component system response regulator YesN